MAKLAVQPAAGVVQWRPPIEPTATLSDAPTGRRGKGDGDCDGERDGDRDGDCEGDQEGARDGDRDGDGDCDGDGGGMHELALVEPGALVQPF